MESGLEDIAYITNPYLFGSKSVLPVLSRMVENIDNGIELEPIQFYNMMVVSHQVERQIIDYNYFNIYLKAENIDKLKQMLFMITD